MGTSAPHSDDPLVAAAFQLIDDVGLFLRPEAQHRLGLLRTALREPLRLALAGRVSAGKSTLANALLGRHIAPTAAGECTQVVTWYRYGAPDRAELVLHNGATLPVPLTDGLPDRLGVDPASVQRLEVTLQSAPLRHFILIDTPGLGGMGRPGDVAARAAVAGESSDAEAQVGADAVLFLFRDVEKRADFDFLSHYRQSVPAVHAGAVTVIGVLSHADVFASGPWSDDDPLAAAAAVADRIAEEHAGRLTAVTPVAGLLAEAARTGRLGETDARGMAELAAVDGRRLQMHEVVGLPNGADPAVIERVLQRAGPYVLNRGRVVAAEGGAVALRDWMDERSGLGRLEDLIQTRFARRSRPLKVARVLVELERLVQSHPIDLVARRRLQDRLEEWRIDPAGHRLQELLSLGRLATVPDAVSMREQLRRLVDHDEPADRLGVPTSTAPEELRAEARRLAGQAQAQAARARHPAEAAAARVLSRSYQLLAQQL